MVRSILALSLCTSLVCFVSCRGGPTRPETLHIVGTVFFREGDVLGPGTRVEIRLRACPGSSEAEIPATGVVAVLEQLDPGPTPIPFDLAVLDSDIDPAREYVLEASIWSGEKELFKSAERNYVLTHARPTRVDVLVRRASD